MAGPPNLTGIVVPGARIPAVATNTITYADRAVRARMARPDPCGGHRHGGYRAAAAGTGMPGPADVRTVRSAGG